MTGDGSVQGRTAYIAWSSGAQSVDVTASYVGLVALARSTQDKAMRVADPDQLIEVVFAADGGRARDAPVVGRQKLANFVAAPRPLAGNAWYWPSPRSHSLAGVALRTSVCRAARRRRRRRRLTASRQIRRDARQRHAAI